MARLSDYYKSEVAPAMMKKFGYKSVMQIPKLEKVVINVGCGEARDNAKVQNHWPEGCGLYGEKVRR